MAYLYSVEVKRDNRVSVIKVIASDDDDATMQALDHVGVEVRPTRLRRVDRDDYVIKGPDGSVATVVRFENPKCKCGHAMHTGVCRSQPGLPDNGCDCPQGERE